MLFGHGVISVEVLNLQNVKFFVLRVITKRRKNKDR